MKGSLMLLFGLVAAVMVKEKAYRPAQPPEPLRPAQEFCDEVAHELILSVQNGLMSDEHATSIVRRCFEVYK